MNPEDNIIFHSFVLLELLWITHTKEPLKSPLVSPTIWKVESNVVVAINRVWICNMEP